MEEPQLAFSAGPFPIIKTSSLILLLFILLAIFAFFLRHRVEFARLSSARGSHPPTKVKRTKGATGRRYHPKKKKNKKNQKKRMARMDSLLDSSVEDIPVPILQPRSANTDSARNESKSSGMLLLDCFLDHLPFPVLEPIRKQSTLQLRYVDDESDSDMPAVAQWDGRVRWTIKGCSVFENQQEEAGALLNRANLLRQQPLSNHWVFQYGLRYIPSEQETNVYRTVRIEDLPTDTTLEDVLRLVPGNIYSARLFDTVAITGHSTVIIVFVEEQDARGFVRLAKGNLDIGSSLATVTLVNTPTYPMSPEMDKLIKRGHSRCVVVSNLGTNAKQDLARVIDKSAYHSYVERMEDGPLEGHVSIRFHCIRSASNVSTLLKGHPMFWKCTVSFLNETEEDLVLTEA